MPELLTQVQEKANAWLKSPAIDQETKDQVRKLLQQEDTKPLIDAFYKDLEFGTGGLRGVMGPGSNGMNKYTVGKATQGLCNYLKKVKSDQSLSVAIAFDSRINSLAFAHVTASVFAANNITVYRFKELRPTPLLSFALRFKNCQAGIVITASHNPKEYNGYKVYWSDGGQVVPPHDQNIMLEVERISSFDEIKFGPELASIHEIDQEVEEAYFQEVLKTIPNLETVKIHNNLSIVYSSLHGSGITLVPSGLEKMGFTNVHLVEQQQQPDGNFPTVHSPNPEEQSAMKLALQKGVETQAALVMATDPDADRVGLGIQNNQGDFFLLNGNQAFCLMMDFLLQYRKGRKKGYIAKTIVTSELIDTMAKSLSIPCYNTLTGFKYIAELIHRLEGQEELIAAGEESYGYMVGDFVRDKDAVSACMVFAAMAAQAQSEKRTLFDWLLDLYMQHGFYQEKLVNVVKKGQQGEMEIKRMMENFRNHTPADIQGEKVVRILDYQNLTEKNLLTGTTSSLAFPTSNVLQFYLEDDTKISIRPSGTEPKIKFYISARTTLQHRDQFQETSGKLDERIRNIEAYLLKS